MPITTSAQIIAVKSPGFALDPRLTDFIGLAELQLSKTMFGDKGEYAIALLVLHWLALDALGGGSATTSGSGVAGSIESEKEGELSRSYSIPSGGNQGQASTYYNQTIFGQELYQLIRGCFILPMNRCI